MVWFKFNKDKDEIVEINILLDPQIETQESAKTSMNNIIDLFYQKSTQIETRDLYFKPKELEKSTPETEPERSRTLVIAQLRKEIKEESSKCRKSSDGRKIFPRDLKERIVFCVNELKEEDPSMTNKKIASLIGIGDATFGPWLRGKYMKHKRKRHRHFPAKPRPQGKMLSKEARITRNNSMIYYCNEHENEAWDKIGARFNLSPEGVYNIYKASKKPKNLSRSWNGLGKNVLREPKYTPPEKKKTPIEAFFKFEHSKMNQEETLKALNECLEKGTLNYKEDANRFGFDRRLLPTTSWFDFITEVATKVNKTMGREVILNDTMTGLKFK